ncbi:MAG TPA: hypothetical protein VIR15_13740 [Intrasporangium sp.]|uniref:hypothetical protein n=1 Tax=Intrasporangium sp. TaxID=1925024 RepID=UPI002F94EB79
MAKVKNETGEALDIPEMGRFVLPDQVIEVDDAISHRFTQSANWSPADKAAEAAHKAGEKALGRVATDTTGKGE